MYLPRDDNYVLGRSLLDHTGCPDDNYAKPEVKKTANTRTKTSSTAPTFQELRPRFHRGLLAQNKSPKTAKTYLESLRLLEDFLEAQGMPLRVVRLTRERLESFVTELLGRVPTSMANNSRKLPFQTHWAVELSELAQVTAGLLAPLGRVK